MQQTKEILAQVKRVELSTKKLVEGLLQGSYHSVFMGRGIEFSEVREYAPGDDIRSIDWNVTARMDTPFVKEFIEERDLNIIICLDTSASLDFGKDTSKIRKTIEISASLMFAALSNHDRVGLCLFTEDVEKFIPPNTGKKHILQLITHMVEHKRKKKSTNLTPLLKFINSVVKRRSIIFLISDFISEDNYQKYLAHTSKRHDVVAILFEDDVESNFPDVGYIELEDEETGEQLLVDSSDSAFRANFKRLYNEKKKNIEKMFIKNKVDLISLKDNEKYEYALKKFFKKRIERMVK